MVTVPVSRLHKTNFFIHSEFMLFKILCIRMHYSIMYIKNANARG
jgi:hypothetical protein